MHNPFKPAVFPKKLENLQSLEFWVLWTFATWFGGLIGGWVGRWISYYVVLNPFSPFPPSIGDGQTTFPPCTLLSHSQIVLQGLIYGLVGGLCLGICQWIVLRSWIPGIRKWVIFTTLGWSIGMVLGASVNIFTQGSTLGPFLESFAFGSAIGLPEWIILRKNYQYSAWCIFLWSVLEIALLLNPTNPFTISPAFSGFCGAVTGLLMILILKHPRVVLEDGSSLVEEQ